MRLARSRWLDQLEAEPGRRVRAGPECEAGVDHDRDETRRRLLPGRPDPERADLDRAVEAHPLVSQPSGTVSTRTSPNLARNRSAPASSVNATSSVASAPGNSANPSGKSSSIARGRFLDVRAGNDDRSAQKAQRKALFSFSKKPSSGLYVSSFAVCSNSPSSRRCSSVELPRHDDVDEHAVVAPAEALEHGHAAAAENANGAWLRPGLEVELLLALQRRDRRSRAERGLGHRQVDRRVDIVALTHEPLVWADPDEHVDVARLPAERARMALAREPDSLSVVDARRDLHVETSLLERPPRAGTGLARMLDDSPCATATRAGLCCG